MRGKSKFSGNYLGYLFHPAGSRKACRIGPFRRPAINLNPAQLSRPARALLGLALLSLIWGYNWVVMKSALADAGALTFTALRSALGALGLFLIMLWQRKPLRLTRPTATLTLGVLQTALFVGLTMAALIHGGAGKTAVLVYTMPFWVLLLAWPLLGERLHGLQWPAVALACAGLVLVLAPWRPAGSPTSEMLAIAAGLAWALAALQAKHMGRSQRFDLLSLTAWQMALGSLPLVALTLVLPEPSIHWTPYFIGALLYNVVLGNALAWWLWLYVLQNLPAGVASLGTLAIPVIGVLAAWMQLGEQPGKIEIVGMALIGVGLGLLALAAMRRRAVASPDP